MAHEQEPSFGETVRRLRTEREVGLRRFAELVGLSPTFLSRMERDQLKPPGEQKVIAIAKALGQDPDEMLALAGRVASDLPEIIQQHPKEMADFLRTARTLTREDIEALSRQAEKRGGAKDGGG